MPKIVDKKTKSPTRSAIQDFINEQVSQTTSSSTTSLNSQLIEIKTNTEMFNNSVDQLKIRWLTLEAQLNDIDALLPTHVHSEIPNDENNHIHLAISRFRGEWHIYGGVAHKDYEIDVDDLQHISGLKLETLYLCSSAIVPLLSSIRFTAMDRCQSALNALEDFDEQLAMLGMDLSENNNASEGEGK